MNKDKLIGICAACLSLKGISEIRHVDYAYGDGTIIPFLSIALAFIAAYAVIKEMKWGYILAAVVMGFSLAMRILAEFTFGYFQDGEKVLILLFPDQTAYLLFGLLSAVILVMKARRPIQSAQVNPYNPPENPRTT